MQARRGLGAFPGWTLVLLVVTAGAGLGCRAAAPAAAAAAAPLDQDGYRRPDLLVAALHFGPGAAVADVGAGAGYLTHRLAARAGAGGHVTATDIDAAALARIGASRPGEAPIETRLVSPDDPGLERARYDLVLLSEVDHLLADRTAYLRKLAGTLTATGRIAISNRLVFRAPTLKAGEQAGLHQVADYTGLPGQFLIELAP
jgi:2-polyprenyl-3-methyl-5-hydroxy-6-metoxy-1,4-benzoquinol methylase